MSADREAASREKVWTAFDVVDELVSRLEAELAAAREREQALREALRQFVDAWQESPDDFEPLDVAAGNAMMLLGDLLAATGGQQE